MTDASSIGSINSSGIYTWTDVGVELVSVPSGPGRSPDNSSGNSDAEYDDGFEDLVSFLWVHHTRLRALIRSDHVDWEHLVCFSVSRVLRIPLQLGSRFCYQPEPDVYALACFLGEDRVGPRLKTILSRHSPVWDWETFLIKGVSNVLRLP